LRGGLAFAVIFVGALLAATTGVVAASVISMGLISLPIMLRYGYDRSFASGVIAASGTLAQIIPPSLVLIVMADQLGKSVGDMYAGAFVPGLVLAGLYAAYTVGITLVKPSWAPALPLEARTFREPNGGSGIASLSVLVVVAVCVSVAFSKYYYPPDAPLDELLVVSTAAGVGVAFVASVLNHVLKLGLLSKIATRVTFVLIPPLGLIFLVLGTIFLGVATPTEGGAMGATGALAMALVRRRISFPLLRQAMDATAKLTSFVVFILVGSRVFSLTFYGVDGHLWVEHLLLNLPGGQLGFLIVVNLLVFVLAFFLDFFELAFIIIPLLGPVAEKLGIDLIWFGVLLAVNMQTSFMHPPFGFALFYLRSVAPAQDYLDRISGKRIAKVTTGQIYWGAVAFVLIQVLMVALIIAVPGIVGGGLAKKAAVDTDKMEIQMPDAAPGGAAKSESDMENALERELSDEKAIEPPADTKSGADGGANKDDAAAAKPPAGKKN
jgi:TRAP-type mannitol/chloroaromatic compound transport system permease large subunit